MREILHQIQEMRKSAKLKPEDKIEIVYDAVDDISRVIKNNEDVIKKTTITKEITLRKKPPYLVEKQTTIDGKEIWLAIKKI